MFGDFVQHNANAPEALEFEKWIQENLLVARNFFRSDWDEAFKKLPPQRFAFCPGSSERFLAGILTPSQDESARNYPFVVFVTVAQAEMKTKELSLVPVIFDSVFQELSRASERMIHGREFQEVLPHLKKLEFQIDLQRSSCLENYEEFLSHTTLENLWINIWGSVEDARKYLLFQNLVNITLPLRSRKLSRISIGLKFPLSYIEANLPYEIVFWLDLANRFLGSALQKPAFFWSAELSGEAPPGLLLFFQKPPATFFLLLARSGLDHDQLCVLDRHGDAQPENIAPFLREMIESPRITLGEFLQKISAAAWPENP